MQDDSVIDERAGLGSGSGYARDKGCAANRKMARIAKESGKEPEPEQCIKEGRNIHAFMVSGYVEGITDDERLTAEFLAKQANRLMSEFLGGRTGVTRLEQRYWLYRGITPVRSSKPDYVCVVHETDGADILIIDHKTGHQDPTEYDPDCSQLEEYALTVALNTQHPRGIKRVKAYYNTRWHGVIGKEFSAEKLARIHSELMDTYAAASVENPPANPGWYCRWCSGRLVCPAARYELDKVDRSTALPVGALPEGKPGELFIEQVKRVETLCDQILKHYKKRLADAPGCCGDWVISEGDEVRTINDIEQAYALLVGTAGKPISHEAFMAACDAHIGKLEKSYCNTAGKIQRRAKTEFNELLAPLIALKRKTGSLQKVKHFNERK